MTSVFKAPSIQFVGLLIILGTIEGTIVRTIDLTNSHVRTVNELPSGYTYHDEIKSAYKLFTTELSWSNAVLACKAHGANLAVIDTWQKVGFISPQVQWLTYAWIGISSDGVTSPWKDVDGELVSTHLPWGKLGYIPLSGSCLAVSGITGGLCNWFCNMRKMYVCEIRGERSSQIAHEQLSESQQEWNL